MPLWDIKSKSLRFLVNHFIGSFLANALDEKQIVLLEDGIACLDVYLKIEKLNAMLAEQNIPIVVCIAFVSEIIIHSPLSIEINGLDLVIQTTPYNFSKHSDSMINSLISNMTALAVAAANAANGEDDLEGERSRDPSSVELDSCIDPQVEKFVEKLDSFAQKLEQSTNETTTSLIDQTAIERAARFIDSLITGATIIFRDLQLRLQCPLTLAGVHRACDLQLRIHLLEFTNASPSNEPDSASTAPSSARAHQSRTEHPKTGDVSGEQGNSARLWSWLWNRRWTSSEERCRDPPSGSSGLSNSDHTCSAIPTILTKNIRMDDVTVHWDLWDTSVATDQQTTCSSAASLSRSQSSRGSSRDRCLSQPPAPSSPKGFFIGPTAESMIASACLLTLPMEQNFVSVCMRDPAFVSKMLSPTTSDNSASVPGTIASAVPSDHPSNLPFGSSGCGGPTLLDLSIDLGPLIVCACPSEFFWLHLMLTQLTSLWEAFAAGRWAQEDDSTSQSKNQVGAPVSAAVTMTTTTASPRHRRCTSSENLLQSLVGAPNEAPAHHFVDLDLSGNSPDQRAISPSPSMIDSRMFRTCMNVAEYNEDFKSNPDQGGMPFSFSGRCRFFYLLLLLDDEEAATTSTVGVKDQSESELHPQRPRLSSAPLSRLSSLEPAPGSASEADASSEEQFHEALSDISPVGGDVSGDTNGSRSSRLNSNTNHANFSLMTSPAALESIAHFFARLRDNLSLGKTAPPGGDPADPLQQEISLSLLFNFTEAFRRKKLTARDWVAEVSSRLSEMAAPASHLCLSLGLCQAEANFDSPTDAAGDDLNVGGGGGGGGPEPLSRKTTSATAAVAAAGVGGELRISAQANGLLLSECLFLPDDSNVDSVVPSVVQLLTFDDSGASSSSPAVRLHLLTAASASQPPYCGFHDCDSSPLYCRSPIRFQLAPCSIDLDPSLCDRVHRLVDALTEAQQVAANIVVTESFSEEDTRVRTWLSAGKHAEKSRHDHLLHPSTDETLCGTQRPALPTGLQFLLGEERGDDEDGAADCRRNQAHNHLPAPDPCRTDFPLFNLFCPSLCITIRVPVPLEAFAVPPKASHLQTQTDDSSDPGEWDVNRRLLLPPPVWWRPTLRPEYFSIRIEALEASSSNQSAVCEPVLGRSNAATDIHGTAAHPIAQTQRRPMHAPVMVSTAPPRHRLNYGDQAFELRFKLLECLVCGPDLENTAFLRLLDRPGSGRPSVFVRVAPLGRQHLDEQDLRTDVLSHYHRTASPLGTAGDEGVASKLRSASVEVATSSEVRAEAKLSDAQPTHNSRSIEEMEEELLQRVAPKENRRTPFVYRKTFLENDAQCHWDKQTVLPGNADHMAGYRSLATQQSRILVDMSAPLVILNLPNDRVTTLIYTRAFHDLSLWHSLLPSDRRIRACLRRPRPGSPSTTVGSLLADHRYWFLSEPAPFISIYALPQAAAEREANLRYHASETGTLATTHGRLFDPSFESDDSSVGALSDSDPQPKPNRHDGDKDLADGLHGLRHQQSLLFLNLFFDHVEARTRLTPILGLATDVPSAQAVLLARHVRITHEVEPSGQVDLKYSTVDIRNFDCHVLDSFDVKSQQEGTGGLHESKNNIPLLRPFVNPVFPKQTDENSLSEESMLSIAFESTTRPPTVTADKANKTASPTVMEELCVSICLRRVCLILWPKLDGWSPQVAACGTSPCWLQRIVDSLSPKVDLAAEYPAFTPPSYSVKQHFHLQEVGVTWPPSSAFTFCEVSPFYSGDSDQPPSTLSDVHPLIVLGETSFYGKVVEPASPQSSGCEASSLVGFIQNAVFWLIPPQEPSPSKRKLRNLRRLLSGSSAPDSTTRQQTVPTDAVDFPRSSIITAEVTDFLDWFAKLDLTEAKHAVRVAELDHAEVRVFTEPVAAATFADISTSNPNLAGTSAGQARVDIRLTNNILRLYSCADTLVALKLLTSDLTATSLASPPSTGRGRSSSSHVSPSRPLSTPHNSLVQRRLSEVPRCDDYDSASELAIQGSHNDFTADAGRTTITSESSITSLLTDAISDVEPSSTAPSVRLFPSSPPTSSQPRTKPQPRKRGPRSLPEDSCVPHASSSTSSDEFVVVTPVPGGRPQDDRHFTQGSTSLQQRLRPREDFYADVDDEEAPTVLGPPNLSIAQDPSATGSIVTTTRLAGSSRRRKMFSDPAACGSTPPTFALTIFDFSLEWTFFGGSDFLRPLSQGEGRKREPSSRVSVLTCTPSTDSRVRVTPRPDIVVSSGEERFGRQALTPSATSPGTGRQLDKSVVVCLTNIYFRKSVFPKSSISSTDASKASTSAATDSFDHHSPTAATTTTSHRPSAQQCLPLTRYALRVADLRIVDRVSSSRVNRLLHARRLGGSSAGCAAGLAARPREVVRASLLFQPTPPSALLLAEEQHRGCSRKLSSGCGVHCENFNEDLEAEVKLSVQPLQVNLDQNLLIFLCESHAAFRALLELGLEELESRISLLGSAPSPTYWATETVGSQNSSPETGEPISASSPKSFIRQQTGDEGTNVIQENQQIFIRKLTFSPSLPIRFNYVGRQLDLRQGALVGLLALCLQLNNAELILPRRVYQRGYLGVSSLLEEIFADVTNSIQSQLPHVLISSVGPMHEVTNIVHGVWDLVHKSIDGLRRHPSDSILTRLGNRDAYVCTRCRSVIQPDQKRTCACSRLGLPLTLSNPEHFIYGLRSGVRSFSANAIWSTLELSAQSVRVIQSLFETAYDILTPGPSIRHRQARLRQPADLREGLSNAVHAVVRGVNLITSDFRGVMQGPVGTVDPLNKGSVGALGDVLRQIPPAMVTPLVAGCEATANILGGLRNQMRPEAKLEDEEKWKDTHGL